MVAKRLKGNKFVQFEGDEALKKALKKIEKKYPEAVTVAMYQEGLIIFEESQEEVPVATGTLRRSGIVFLRRMLGNYVIVIGYGTQYALRIHEDTKLDVGRQQRAELSLGNPKYKTKLSTTGKSKYLEDPFKRAIAGFETRVMIRTRNLVRVSGSSLSSVRTVRGKGKGGNS